MATLECPQAQGGPLTHTGFAQCDDEWVAVSPHWGLFGTSMGSDLHLLPSTYMEGVQNKRDFMAELEHLSENLVVMSRAWHKS